MSEITEFRNEAMSMFAMMIQRFDAMDQRFDEIDRKFDAIDKKFEEIDHRFEKMEQGFIAGFRDLSNLIGAFQSETNKRFDNIEDRLSNLEAWRNVVQFKRM